MPTTKNGWCVPRPAADGYRLLPEFPLQPPGESPAPNHGPGTRPPSISQRRLALNYCRPLRIPIVFTNHTRYDLYAQAYLPLLPEEFSDTFLQTYMPTFCQAVDLVISPSAGMGEVLQKLGVSTPIEIIPNGVDLQLYRATCRKLPSGIRVPGRRYPAHFFRAARDRKRTWIFSSAPLPGPPKPSRTPTCWSSAADRKSRR